MFKVVEKQVTRKVYYSKNNKCVLSIILIMAERLH